jgi:glycosyltransferase involved in cell wall biosynthesis
MKVMQIITRVNRGGTAKWLEILSQGLTANGHINLLVAGDVHENEVEDPLFEKLGGIRVSNLGRSISLQQDIRAFVELRRIIKDQKPDLINTHTSKAGALGRIAAISILSGRPAIVHTYHGHLLYGYFGKLKVKVIVTIEKFLAQFSSLLIVSGERVRDELLEVGIGEKSKFVLIKPGIPALSFANKIETRKILGIPSDAIVVGWLGRFTEIKHPERVLEIAAWAPNVIFLMGGDGELHELISQLAPPNVRLIGWTTPETLWGASDIAILTSDNEAQPISLVEAAMAGLPTIALNVGSIESVIADGETGFLVKNPREISERIIELVNKESLRSELGNRARIKMNKEFSEAQFIDSHVHSYEKALNSQ